MARLFKHAKKRFEGEWTTDRDARRRRGRRQRRERMSLRALFASATTQDGANARAARGCAQDGDANAVDATVSSGTTVAQRAAAAAAADIASTTCADHALSTLSSPLRAAKTYTRRKKPSARVERASAATRVGGDDGAHSPSTCARPAKVAKTSTQMCLDLGQASLRHVTCARCGLVYAKGDPADEKTHARFHEKFLADGASGGMTLKIPADARVVWMSEDGDVSCIILDDAAKAERVARGVERELVMPENFARAAKSGGAAKAFVCVSKKGNKILAALFAEKITAAFRTLEESDEKKAMSGSTVTCGVAEEKATCGIRAIWTHASARKKGYARAMLNAMRANMVPGYIVPVKECAFTQPTEAGAALASRYCEAKTFLVY